MAQPFDILKLTNAANGKTESGGGMNIAELRQAGRPVVLEIVRLRGGGKSVDKACSVVLEIVPAACMWIYVVVKKRSHSRRLFAKPPHREL